MTGTAAARNIVLAVFCWISLSLPALAQGVGAIGGIVSDASGAVLPGVTVTLSSPQGAIGGSQTTFTDGRGAYQFTRLVPGQYTVKAELQGFQTVIQEGINVSADRTARADLKLALAELAETITVVGETPLLDTTSTVRQTVMTRDVLDTLPMATDIWSIARLAPAVTLSRYDVGGRELIGQSRAFAHGSTRDEYGYMIDGMDITSYAGGISFQVDTNSFEEIAYQTSNAPAQWASGGVVMNMITKTGTNVVRGNGMFTTRTREFDNVSPALRQQLLAGVPALVLAANPDLKPGGRLDRLYDSALSVSGPIMPDHLWFLGSARFGEAYAYRVGSYNADGTQLLIDHQLINTLAKTSWAVTQNNQWHIMHGWVRKGRFHVAETGTATEFFDQAATHYNDSRNHLFLTRWTSVLSSRMVMDVAGVTHYGNNNQQLQRKPEVKPGTLPLYDAVTRVNSAAKGTYNINEGIRTNVQSSLSYVTGTHDLKVGYQFVRNQQTVGGISTSHYPAGLRAVFRNGVPDSVNTYNTPTKYDRTYDEQAVYVQDKWTPARKVTVNLGVRFETIYGWVNDGKSPLCQEETIFIEGRCFPPVKGVPNFKTAVPRVSAIYDLFGDGRTALKFSANRYRYLTQLNGLINQVVPIRLTNDTRTWSDLNGDRIPQLNELGPSTGFNLGTTNRHDPNLRMPYVNELAAEFERELPGSVVASVGYHYRTHRNMIGATNMAVPRESYTPLQVTEVNSGRQVTVYNQSPALRGQFDVVWANHRELDRNFHGVDLAVRRRMRDGWMLMGSLTFGSTEGDIYDGADLNNPNLTFRRGPHDESDMPVAFKLSGAYELPYGVTVAASGQHYTGWPETTIVRVAANTVRLTQVNQNIVIEPRGTTRLPDITMVDLSFKKSVRQGGLRIEPNLEIFNLFNAAAITRRIAQLGPAYGQATELLGARLIKVGAHFSW